MSENKNISQDVVAHMAQLSRLAVSDEEKALFARQFGDTVSYTHLTLPTILLV